MKKFLLLLALLAAIVSPLHAQQRVTTVAMSLPVTGNITASTNTVTLTIPPGQGFATIGVDITGTWVGTIAVQCAVRSQTSDFIAIRLTPYDSTSAVTSMTANGSWSGGIGGCSRVRAIWTAWTSGTAVVTLNAVALGGSGSGGGGGSIGTVDQGTSPWVVGDGSGAMNVIVDSGTLTAVTSITNAVTITDGAGAVNVICDSGCSGGTQYTQDAALTVATTVMTMAGGRASAAVPTDVSADNDAVLAWFLRSGAGVTQPSFGGVLAVAGNGASGTGVQRVTLANDSTGVLASVGTVTAVTGITNNVNIIGTLAHNGAAAGTNRVATLPAVVENTAPTHTDGRNAALSLTTGGAARVMITNAAGTATSVATDATHDSAASSTGPQVMGVAVTDATTLPSAVTAADAVRFATSLQGVVYTRQIDPCSGAVKLKTVLDIASATTTEIIDQSASNKAYICSINIVSAGANNIALVEDGTNTCASPDAGMAGGLTAAEGWNFAANGGLTQSGGGQSLTFTTSTNVNVCLITSGSGQVSGVITYVLAP